MFVDCLTLNVVDFLLHCGIWIILLPCVFTFILIGMICDGSYIIYVLDVLCMLSLDKSYLLVDQFHIYQYHS